MKRCPTEAIRVRGGKATVLYERCIACGECVRCCPYYAKKAVYDSIEDISRFKYKVALPPPALYGQFNNLKDVDYILEGLLKIGFDDVYEVSLGAEFVGEALNGMIESKKLLKKPLISAACPAVVELILLKFHYLKDNISGLLTPAEAAAKLAREKAEAETGLDPGEIGVYYISCCPAYVSALEKSRDGGRRLVDGALSVREIYLRLINEMPKIETPKKMRRSGGKGLSWATSGGEAAELFGDGGVCIAADGLENVTDILKQVEDGKLDGVDFIELNACSGGCVGGVLNVENPFIAKAKINALKRDSYLPENREAPLEKPPEFFIQERERELSGAFRIDDDISRAMVKLREISEIRRCLAHLDCGICGAPSCNAFSEDVVLRGQPLHACVRFRLPEFGE